MRWVAGLVAAVAAACSLAVGLGSAGGLQGVRGGLALAAGAAVGGWVWWRSREQQKVRPGWWDGLVMAGWGLATWRAFFWVLYPVGDEWRILSPHNLGDLSLHIGLIRYLASGVDFWPPSLILAGEPLKYPVGTDLLNALLLLCGVGLREGLVWVGVALSLCGGFALWRLGGPMGVLAVLAGGGLAGWGLFLGAPWQEFGADGVWKNAFLTMVVPQRGFLYALPAGALLVWAWREEFFLGRRVLPLAGQVLIYSTLPLFQLHAFLVLSVVLALAWMFRRERGPLLLAGLSVVPATVFVLLVTANFSAGGRLRFDPGWTVGEGGLVGFFLEFGPALAAGTVALAMAWRQGAACERWLATSALALASLGFLFPLTEWDWDNTKVLVWAWILAVPVVWERVVRPLPLPGRSVVLGVLFFSGAAGLVAGLDGRHGYLLARRSELAHWQHLLESNGVGPGHVIACPPEYNHPVILLGRRVVCGYEGHLASHGLDYRQKMAGLRRVLSMEEGWEALAREIGADFVALGTRGEPEFLRVPPPLPKQSK